MKTRGTKNWRSVVVSFSVLLALAAPMPGEAGSMEDAAGLLVGKGCLRISTRPLSDFLKAQGTLPGPQFFPPVKNYVGWADNPFVTFALVDYAGLANEYIKEQTGQSLGTKASGVVLECKRANGRAQIAVALLTMRASGFAQSFEDLDENGFDFANTPTIFGAKTVDVVAGADAAVGPVVLLTTFSISAPGAALPDFLDVVNNIAPYAPIKLSFTSTTFGKCSDGTRARLDVHQVAASNDEDELVFSREIVELTDRDGGDCVDD